MNNTIAIKTNCYKGYELIDALKGIKEAGFKYIELSVSPNNSFQVSSKETPERLNYVKKSLKEYNLTPVAIGGRPSIMDVSNSDAFIENIKLASFFNCHYLVVSICDSLKEENDIPKDDEIVNRLKYFIPYLDEYDVKLVIEIHHNHATGKKLKDICQLVNSNRVMINYDTANAIFYSLFDNEELLKDIEDSIDYISYMHIKDKLGKKNEWNFPALGKGYVPLDDIFKIICKHGNQCPLVTEIEFTGGEKPELTNINQAVKDSAIYLKKRGFNI